MASKLVAIIAGTGPGTGAAIARKFAQAYPVILLARKKESYDRLAEEINSSGGSAFGISADVSDEQSMKSALDQVRKEFGEDVAAAVSVLFAFAICTFSTGLTPSRPPFSTRGHQQLESHS
jgi:NAD(P)-dependent dehydrogenase (short-subunit alcohol dehydrogenase family)